MNMESVMNINDRTYVVRRYEKMPAVNAGRQVDIFPVGSENTLTVQRGRVPESVKLTTRPVDVNGDAVFDASRWHEVTVDGGLLEKEITWVMETDA